MESRYDFMTESKVCDKEDGVPYPDVLSTNYSDFALTKIPKIKRIAAKDISKMWMYMYENYGISYYDDLLLNMNGIGYVGELEPGSQLFNFDLVDIEGFNNNKRKEAE